MKKFRFRLEGLYRLRQEEERQALFVVQGLRQKEVFLHQNLKTLAEERQETICFYNQAGLTQNGQSELLLIEQYLVALERQQRKQEEELRVLQKEIRKALEDVQKAYRARRQVEYLRDRQRTDFENNLRQIERRDVDEMNALRFVHSERASNGSDSFRPLERSERSGRDRQMGVRGRAAISPES